MAGAMNDIGDFAIPVFVDSHVDRVSKGKIRIRKGHATEQEPPLPELLTPEMLYKTAFTIVRGREANRHADVAPLLPSRLVMDHLSQYHFTSHARRYFEVSPILT